MVKLSILTASLRVFREQHHVLATLKPEYGLCNFRFTRYQYLTADSAGTFRFDSIAAGKGHVGYFMDKNKNRIPDKGRIYPWHSPEPYFSATDTAEARARWDVEGVSVSICDPCGFSAIDSISADTVDSKAQ